MSVDRPWVYDRNRKMIENMSLRNGGPTTNNHFKLGSFGVELKPQS